LAHNGTTATTDCATEVAEPSDADADNNGNDDDDYEP